MQKLEERNTYTPTSAVPACGSVVEGLNSSERVGAVSFSLKTSSNNSEEHLTREQGGHSILVPVLNNHGKPLMPCKAVKAKKLLKENKAKVVSRTPFVIKLLFGSSGYKQDITLGVDAGYSKIGYSAITDKRELIAGELELRNDIKRLLGKRKLYRRNRRIRLWYRPPRFLNRGIKKGWLAPSMQHKLDSHIKLIEKIKKVFPITKVVIEVASFDTQKMQNPEISGIEYQQGELQGYEVREYLLEKWKRKCAYCKKTNIPLEVEHIIPISRGGSDRVSNLTISCNECNQKKGNKTAKEFGYPNIQKQAKTSLRSTVFMNLIRWKLVNLLNCDWTYGCITKHDRIKLKLDKSHSNDAFVIASGTKQTQSEHIIVSKQVRRQNRSLYKANFLKGGRLKRNTVKKVNGFRRFDKVLYEGIRCFIFALRSKGYFDLRDIANNKIGVSVNYKKLRLLEHAKGIIQEVCAIPSTTKAVGILARIR